MPPDFALHWARQLGARSGSLERLRGGINNRVFRCGSGQQFWVIKGYAPRSHGQRDRMQAEIEFLRFAAKAAPGFTPGLIQIDRERRCVVLEHIEGDTLPEGEPPSDADLAEAVEFFRQLNAEPHLARASINLDAAEGFLSLREHLGNVRERLDRMTCAHLDPELRSYADTLLRRLHLELECADKYITTLLHRGMVTDAIDPDERCVSPSDFGFHNAIRTSAGIRFIDFEFAGWDDPAKAIQDFILQPRVPVAKHQSPLLELFPPERYQSVHLRCQAIAPVLKLKWLCILLSILQPARLGEILGVTSGQSSGLLVQNRLLQADKYLRQIL